MVSRLYFFSAWDSLSDERRKMGRKKGSYKREKNRRKRGDRVGARVRSHHTCERLRGYARCESTGAGGGAKRWRDKEEGWDERARGREREIERRTDTIGREDLVNNARPPVVVAFQPPLRERTLLRVAHSVPLRYDYEARSLPAASLVGISGSRQDHPVNHRRR